MCFCRMLWSYAHLHRVSNNNNNNIPAMADPLDVGAGAQWPSHVLFGVGVCLGEGRLPTLGAPFSGCLVKLGVSQSNVQSSPSLDILFLQAFGAMLVHAGAGSRENPWVGGRRLWSGSRNNPVLHRQRGGHPCRQQRHVFRRAFLSVHRQSGGHSSCSCESGTHGVQTVQQTSEIFAVDVLVIMQLKFQSKVYGLDMQLSYRGWYTQCKLCLRPRRFRRCCSGTC